MGAGAVLSVSAKPLVLSVVDSRRDSDPNSRGALWGGGGVRVPEGQYGVDKSLHSRARQARFECQLCHLVAVSSWSAQLAPLIFHFPL